MWHIEQKFEHEKLAQLVLCIAETAPEIGAVKLEKLLYLCDFVAAERLGVSATGEIYRNFAHGPVAKHLLPVLEGMKNNSALKVEKKKLASGKDFTEFTALKRCDLRSFSPEHREVIHSVLKEFGSWDQKRLEDYVHDDFTYKFTERNEEIPYYLAPYRRYEKPTKEEAEKLLEKPGYVEALKAALA